MKTREEHVRRMKEQLDNWNAEVDKWEAQARGARAEMRVGYAKHLDSLRARREEALYNLKLIEGASAVAWDDLSRGADQAWARMREAIADARGHFEKQK
jgi:hypothetical protein